MNCCWSCSHIWTVVGDKDENDGGKDRRRLVTRTRTVVGGLRVWWWWWLVDGGSWMTVAVQTEKEKEREKREEEINKIPFIFTWNLNYAIKLWLKLQTYPWCHICVNIFVFSYHFSFQLTATKPTFVVTHRNQTQFDEFSPFCLGLGFLRFQNTGMGRVTGI